MSGGIYAVLQHKAILSYLLVLRTCVSPIRLLSRTFVLHDISTGFDQVGFFCRAFSWALLRANSCARQLRGFCFPGSSRTAQVSPINTRSPWEQGLLAFGCPMKMGHENGARKTEKNSCLTSTQ